MGGLTSEQCDVIVAHAERESERLEHEQRQRRAQEKNQVVVNSNHEHDRVEQGQRHQPAAGELAHEGAVVVDQGAASDDAGEMVQEVSPLQAENVVNERGVETLPSE